MLPTPPALVQTPHVSKETAMTARAQGTFDVKVKPLSGDNAEWGGFGRLSIDKQFHGDLEGTSRGQMIAEGGVTKDSGGYVALERVSATLAGRKGTFALQHSGTMVKGKAEMTITVVPDSGTDALKGITGRFHIRIEGGKHSYEFDYTLPTTQEP